MEPTIRIYTKISTPRVTRPTTCANATVEQEDGVDDRSIPNGSRSQGKSTKGNKTTELLGLELELESVNLKNLPDPWKLESDNSLKVQGAEFTCLTQHRDVETNLENLLSNLTYTISSRCSVHVHVNILDLTWDELHSFIALYTIFERYFFEISGRRFNSNYCIPIQHTMRDQLFYKDQRMLQASFPKYAAIHAFAYDEKKRITLGTLEFRHAKATTNPQEIIDWANTIVNLKIAARRLPIKELLASLYEMRSTSAYLNLFQFVFKHEPQITNMAKFKKDIEYGITYVKLTEDY